jgi:endonuclease/exonuclease/phosphatase family metal-dependent hydrolase
MNDLLAGEFATGQWDALSPKVIRVVNWNIDRGLHLPEIIEFLESQQPELLILQEVDLSARRTHGLNVAEELARRLRMNYVFGYEFQELNQGSRTAPAYHGQATLSRWRLARPRVIRFRCQSGFWRPRWFVPRTGPFQRRLGGRIALFTEIDVPGRSLTLYNVHLESRGDNNLRLCQLRDVLTDARAYSPHVSRLVAGDLNCDVSRGVAAQAIVDASFRNVLGATAPHTTPARGAWQRSRRIDWAFVSGGLEATQATVHNGVHASDHYPISFTLTFQ